MENDECTPGRDRELGMHRPISRRDFLNGVAIGLGVLGPGLAGSAEAAQFAQDSPGYYPPALTGMRGSHAGSFEVAHTLRDGSFWKTAGKPVDTRETYDLIIVGGGISGLAAAYFYRARTSSSARILILDNHDDFGGHAKRNEFRAQDRLLIANGGTLEIESPFPYSKEARGLMDQLGIDPVKLSAEASRKADHHVFDGLQPAIFFDQETFGADRLVAGVPGRRRAAQGSLSWKEFLARTPLSAQVQTDIARLEEAKVDYLPDWSSDTKKDRLSRMSYKDFLLNVVKVHPEVIPFYQVRTHGLFGVGIDAVNALDCWGMNYPGFQGMNIAPGATMRMGFTPRGEATPKPDYFFHFPDGNASIARMLVRSLIPAVAPGRTAEDIVTAKFDYSRLDTSASRVRIRLSSSVVRARHAGDPASAKEVEVAYVRDKQLYNVRGKSVVMACWNMMIPYLCEELPEKQKEALQYGVKIPLVYTTVAVRNWTSFKKLGIRNVSAPGMYHYGVNLEEPTTIGEYHAAPKSPEDPALLRMTRTPCKPGLSERDQHRAGHVDLFTTSFETFERKIRDQLVRVLGAGGFDPARDIAAITVNRWPHGYAYEYNYLFDPEWPDGQQPCQIARRRFGRIAIANSDAAAAAYTDQAMDQAYRAVGELNSEP
ncbi:MAG: NAD(P)-binding protein [Bryobacteraceae bacterium]